MLSRTIVLLTVLLCAALSPALAQPCSIQNNNITLAPAVCAGSVATLKGSVPTGVTGQISYRWERKLGLCIGGGYQTIPGANAADYVVPQGANPNYCYRRVAIWSNCTDESNPIKVDPQDRTTPEAPEVSLTQPTCTVNTGSITVTSPAPAAGITYSIDGVTFTNTTGVFTGLQPGNYDVVARYTALGCVSPARSVTLNTVATPSGTISPSTASFCEGDNRVLTVTGGTSYQWYRNGNAIPGATGAIFTASEAGTYTADISNGQCTAPAANSAVVTVLPAPTGTITPATASICEGETVILTASGGSSYQWYRNNATISGATSATYTARQGGTYTVEIISNSCRARASNSAVVTVNSIPTGNITPSSAVLCAGGSATLSISGGTSYQWFRNGSQVPGATSATYNVQQPGTYSVAISNGSCTGQSSNTVNVSTSPAINFTVSVTDPTCTTPTGRLTISGVTGGSGHTYSINNGTSFQSGNVFNNLAPGTYQVVVKNSAGCLSDPKTVTIGQPPSSINATAAVTNISCNQSTGSATITATGGTPPFTYSLNGRPAQSGNSFTGLTAGSYNVVVKDATGCTFTVNFTITSTSTTFTATPNVTDARCGAATGTVNIQAAGGTSPYTYSLDNGNFQSSNNFGNVPAGQHSVTVKDNAGCTVTVSFEIIRSGEAPDLVITDPAKICPGATANLQAPAITAGSDANLVYTYWQDNNAINPLSNPSAVQAGNYYIKATNQSGCSSIKPVVVANLPVTPGRITLQGSPSACAGTTVLLTASNGTAYQWYRNDTLIGGATTSTYRAGTAGSYSVAIHDGTCSVLATDRINITFQDCSVMPESKVFVPTAFTPNRNGANDVLRPILYNITTLKYFRVYNRWGQQVFQTNETGKGWDGTINGAKQPSETYTWVLECVDSAGNTIKQSGRTLLIR